MAVIIHKRLLDTTEAAAYLSIGETKLYEWAKRGKVPSLKLDSCRRLDVRELDEFVEKVKAERDQKKPTMDK